MRSTPVPPIPRRPLAAAAGAAAHRAARAARAAVPALLAALLAALAACAPPTSGRIATVPAAARPTLPPPPTSARAALERVRERWEGRWPRTLVARVDAEVYGEDAVPERTGWVQTHGLPGQVRRDYLPVENRSGQLLVNGRVHDFQRGRQTAVERRTELSHVALADLPALPVDSALRTLARLGIDTASFRVAALDGAEAWVIGSGPGTSSPEQLWIDAEQALGVRVLESRAAPAPASRRAPAPPAVLYETRVRDWRRQGSVVLPAVYERRRDGRLTTRERWSAVALDVALPAGTFVPARWTRVPPPPVPVPDAAPPAAAPRR